MINHRLGLYLICHWYYPVIRLWEWNYSSIKFSYISHPPQQASTIVLFVEFLILLYREPYFLFFYKLFQIDYVNSMRAAREFTSRVSDSLKVKFRFCKGRISLFIELASMVSWLFIESWCEILEKKKEENLFFLCSNGSMKDEETMKLTV